MCLFWRNTKKMMTLGRVLIIFKCLNTMYNFSRILAALAPFMMIVTVGSLLAEEVNPANQQVNSIDPRSYGAKGDGTTFDTEALQKAIDACGGTGGKVVLKAGTYLTKPLELHGKMSLRIEKGAVLLGQSGHRGLPGATSQNSGMPSPLCRSLLLRRMPTV